MLPRLVASLFNQGKNPKQLEREAIRASIVKWCKALDLSTELVAAIIWQESKGDRKAQRYEDLFFKKYVAGKSRLELIGHVPLKISLDTEKRNRAFSWGAMQIMGQTAREIGFAYDNFGELMEADIGIEYGCKYLAKCIKRTNRNIEQAVDAYNGGGNPNYSPEVFIIIDRREHEIFL